MKRRKKLIGDLGDEGVLGTFMIPVGTSFQSFEGFAILVGDIDDNTVSIRKMMNQKEDVTKRVFMLFAGKDGASKKAKKTMWDDPPAGETLITAEDADTDIEEAI